jgi:hypothetical protein
MRVEDNIAALKISPPIRFLSPNLIELSVLARLISRA